MSVLCRNKHEWYDQQFHISLQYIQLWSMFEIQKLLSRVTIIRFRWTDLEIEKNIFNLFNWRASSQSVRLDNNQQHTNFLSSNLGTWHSASRNRANKSYLIAISLHAILTIILRNLLKGLMFGNWFRNSDHLDSVCQQI